MNTWLITLSLLCAVTPALADDMSPAPAKAQPEAAMATGRSTSVLTVSSCRACGSQSRVRRRPSG